MRARSGFLASLTPTVQAKGEGGEVDACRSPFMGPVLDQAVEERGDMPLPHLTSPPSARRTIRTDRLSDHVRPRRRFGRGADALGCISRPALFAALKAKGVQRVSGHAACRRRHLPAGQGRRHQRAPHACRVWRQWMPRPAAALNTVHKARAGVSSRSARHRCACWKALRARTATIHPFKSDTSIFITPGYRFRAVDVLMTNFHLPRSTLFMLVSAFAGSTR